MTCKDCIHFEVCDSGRHIGEYIEDDGVYSEGVENDCASFKNKADYAEVVRCKDCIHYVPDSELDHNEFPNHIEADGYCDNCLRYTDKTDFCSSGRKEGDTE